MNNASAAAMLDCAALLASGRPISAVDAAQLSSLLAHPLPEHERALVGRALGRGPVQVSLPHLLRLLGDPSRGVVSEALAAIKWLVPWSGLSPWGVADNPDRCFDAAIGSVFRDLAPESDQAKRILGHLAGLDGAIDEIRRALAPCPQALRESFDHFLRERERLHRPAQITVVTSYRCNVRCNYCYMLSNIDNPGRAMTYAEFEAVVAHARRLGCTRIGFSGGEPTYHPDFSRFVQLLCSSEMSIFFASNIMFARQLVDSLDPRHVGSITAHLRPEADYNAEGWRLFLDNLTALRSRGIHVMLRHTVQPGGTVDTRRLLAVCETTGVRHVNLALAIPSPCGRNSHIDRAQLRVHVGNFVDGLRTLRARGVDVGVSKPLPPCLFNPDQHRVMNSLPHALGTCTMWQVEGTHNVVVNPDGSVWPCVVVDEPVGNFFDFDSIASLGQSILAVTRRRAQKAIFEECHTCPLHSLKRCQGACLAYKA